MKIIIGSVVKIKDINSKNNPKIIHYLHKSGIIAGYKLIYDQYNVPIVQFKDYTRIWMLPTELEIILLSKKSKL